MKRVGIPLATLTVAALLPAGTASAAAYPVKDKTLTHNPLYSAGRLPTTKCTEKPIKKFDPASAKRYLNTVLTCLNRTWSTHLKKLDTRFAKPRLTITTKAPKRFCGAKWSGDSATNYCDNSRTILIVLKRNYLEDPDDLFLFNMLSTFYAQHVQNLTGIHRAFVDIPYRNKAELAEQQRRYNLQGDCLSGAFLKSVWSSLGRSRKDWNELLTYVRDWASTSTGTRKSLEYWISRGFKSGDPRSCNTWSAASSRVA